jgi:membrane-associated protease RseP (regulator of RpoE activity)
MQTRNSESQISFFDKSKNFLIFISLLSATYLTCMIAGTQWAFKDYLEITNWHYGIEYATLLIIFLSAHEFGHYFAARLHKVEATLPYYIPFPLTISINFGTFGAVIKTKTPIPNRKAMFDIGVAGPIAGFIVCTAYLIYGLSTLPGIEYIYHLHPDYVTQLGGRIPNTGLYFGDTLYFHLLSSFFANPTGFLPPMNEIYHYPFLNVGWFGLFVTSLNMLPMGQLDGGHTTFSMFGDKVHFLIARIIFWILLIIGICASLGMFYIFFKIDMDNYWFYLAKDIFYPPLLYINNNFPIVYKGWSGWLLWAMLAKFAIKLRHPPVYDNTPLNPARMLVGALALIILMLSFSFNGIYIIE